MEVQTKIRPMSRDIALVIEATLSPAARSEVLAEFAKATLAETSAQNARVLGRTPPHVTYVDGVAGAPESAVRPEGRIVYEFELVTDLLAFVDRTLREHSPVRSGRYARSHQLLADGKPVDDVTEVPVASEYLFVNSQPYARKIEGNARRKPLSAKAPQGVYQVVAAMAAARYGNIAAVKYTMSSVRGGAIGEWAQSDSAVASSAKRYAFAHTKLKRNRLDADVRTDRRREWLTRQPAVLIRTL